MGSEHSEAQLSICPSSIQPNRSAFLSRNASTATAEQLKSLGWKFKRVTNTRESAAAKPCCFKEKPEEPGPHRPGSTRGCPHVPVSAAPCSVGAPGAASLRAGCRALGFSLLPLFSGPRLAPHHRSPCAGIIANRTLGALWCWGEGFLFSFPKGGSSAEPGRMSKR